VITPEDRNFCSFRLSYKPQYVGLIVPILSVIKIQYN